MNEANEASGDEATEPLRSNPSSEAANSDVSGDVVTESEEMKSHPIASAINRALHRYRDIEAAARIMVPASVSVLRDMWESAHTAFTSAHEKLLVLSESSEVDEAVAAEREEAIVAIDRLSESNLPNTLLVSLFLGLFSAFDAFTGNLLMAIYKKKPILLEALDIEVPLSELLRHESFEDLKQDILADEIEKFRRKSYVEQFEILEKRFGIALKKFEHWPNFVELGQRRNLITHCEGIVSKQYIKVCKENDVSTIDGVTEGQQLQVNFEYLLEACSIIYEVSLKLGQTLWRKIFPDESDEANEHLTQPIYESLRIERWERAILLSEFAASVQKEIKELDKRVRIVNHCIALRFSDKASECEGLLNREDWSAAALDFKLAVAVLREDFQEAALLMNQIGKKGSLVVQNSYHVWPLFREFRRSEHFTRAYHDVFGTSYSKDVVEEVSRAEEKGQEKIGEGEGLGSSIDPHKFRPSLDDIKRMLG